MGLCCSLLLFIRPFLHSRSAVFSAQLRLFTRVIRCGKADILLVSRGFYNTHDCFKGGMNADMASSFHLPRSASSTRETLENTSSESSDNDTAGMAQPSACSQSVMCGLCMQTSLFYRKRTFSCYYSCFAYGNNLFHSCLQSNGTEASSLLLHRSRPRL